MNHNKRKSVLQERKVAADLGGRVQPGSGAPAFYKSDVRKTGDVRVECKTTGSKSYSLKLHDLEKIKAEAVEGGLEGWAMQVEFGHKKFAVIDWQEYLDLRENQKVVEAYMIKDETPCPTCGARPRKASCPLKCDEY